MTTAPLSATPIVVGDSYYGGATRRATRWAEGEAVDLGVVGDAGSEAWGINDDGVAVGISMVEGRSTGVYWTPGGEIVELEGLPGERYGSARAINEAGWIVGCSGDSPVGVEAAELAGKLLVAASAPGRGVCQRANPVMGPTGDS